MSADNAASSLDSAVDAAAMDTATALALHTIAESLAKKEVV